MCLKTVDKTPRRLLKGRWYYKAVGCCGKKLLAFFYDAVFRPGWQRDKKKSRVKATDGRTYDAGYHLFIRRRDAKQWIELGGGEKIIRVKAANIIATGYQKGELAVVVARSLFIPKSEYDKALGRGKA